MELSPINGCVVATTIVDHFGELHETTQRHTRVTRVSIKRLLHAEVVDPPTPYSAIAVCAAVTRIDNFLGIEVVQPEGATEEMDIVALQRSLVGRLRELGGGVLRGMGARALENLKRPLNSASHGPIVARLEPAPQSSPIVVQAFSAGVESLERSLEIPTTAQRLGVQWAKSKMLDIRVDANLAYMQTTSLQP